MMRLTELHPNWYGWYGEGGRIGVLFDCPVHRSPDSSPLGHRCFVPFANPISGRPEPRKHLWQRTGDTFETLSLSPSVDYTKYDSGKVRDLTCWHGFILNGEVS